MSSPLIEFNNVYKQYQDNLVLNNITLKVNSGEIYALVGDNGAGKTTCVRLLAGLENPTNGVIKVANKRIGQFFTPNYQISYAGQDTYFIPDFSVRQNIVLGNEPQFLKIFINWGKTEDKIEKLMRKYKIYVDLNKQFGILSLSEQRKVSLLRALYQKPRILVLDEPTVGLPLEQEEEFLPIFKSFIKDKITVIFSTRSKEFAKAVSNHYSLLNKGRIVWTKHNKNVLKVKKIQHKYWTTMIDHKKVSLKKRELVLYAEDISFNKRNYPKLEGIDLILQVGEILGVYDRTNISSSLIGDIISGKTKSPTVRIFFKNNSINKKNQAYRYKLGIDLVPENFLQDATIDSYSLIDNFILWHHNNPKYLNAGVLRRDDIWFKLKKILQNYQMPDFINGNSIANTLSNGELQKFVLARTLETNPKVVILVNPLMHLDNDSAKLIINRIIALQKKGVAFLLIDCDSHLLELLANRVTVIQNGRMVATLERDDIKSNVLNNPLILSKKREDLIDKHIQITKSELKYKSISRKFLLWQKIINKITIVKDKIVQVIATIKIRITGG
ncbi:ATP-binding cassette domain-containing protein [Spiroplasma endosymbiont of 'Nebria riversi']|uniref:ATP-binding cassette domain-containing protein n=1 Tax=Spiroplasma endosymbiont of 'Nebria riversi' TaxID=2792084 RepID=UPI001C03BA90|nr:ATP-binding cassette domain-containing protein [Spiroplasma endosymbiont of 'Nebria riversi']